ncbi:MAG: NTP transferase domain-containing protein [Pseudomonadota bacterium]|nr:NTP transferase domain-containing protein [Pseudomonadota bacterium]
MEIAILAAGKGTRMNSDLPKVMHPVGGKPMLQHVLDTATELHADAIHVVYGHGGEQVSGYFSPNGVVRDDIPSDDAPRDDIRWVLQAEQLGTGHALQQVLPHASPDATLLVLYGDVPLIRAETLAPLAAIGDGVALLTVELEDPAGMGRILRDAGGAVTGIVEEKDATAAQLKITEINTGFMAAPVRRFRQWLGQLGNDNAQGEYYLTDIIGLAVAEGLPVRDFRAAGADEVLGVNSREDLERVERIYENRLAGS